MENECVLCNNEIEGYGNNASPLKDGLCCDLCNDTKVIPTRLKIAANHPSQTKLLEDKKEE